MYIHSLNTNASYVPQQPTRKEKANEKNEIPTFLDQFLMLG